MPVRNGFTKEQRDWIVRRDGSRCVLCGSTEALHVHHLTPFRWCVTVIGWSIERANLPTNGVTVCASCHNGVKAVDYNSAIHPDNEFARKMYAEDRRSFDKMFAKRDDLCRARVIYWNPTHDNQLAVIAVSNMMTYLLENSDDPPTMWNGIG